MLEAHLWESSCLAMYKQTAIGRTSGNVGSLTIWRVPICPLLITNMLTFQFGMISTHNQALNHLTEKIMMVSQPLLQCILKSAHLYAIM